MSKREKSFLDEVASAALGTFAGILNGDVFDGPDERPHKRKASDEPDDEEEDHDDDEELTDDGDEGDDDEDDEDDEPKRRARAPAGRKAKARPPKKDSIPGLGSILTIRHEVAEPRRGPGRPPGSTKSKPPDAGDGDGK